VVFPRAHGGDEPRGVPPTTTRQGIGNVRVRRDEPEELRVQNVGGYHYMLRRRTGRFGFVGQISHRRGPLRELALARYGDCSLSRFF